MALPVHLLPPVTAPPPTAPTESGRECILQTIGRIALQIITALATPFLWMGGKIFSVKCPEALPLAAPRGIDNAGMNCWINALAQTIFCDKGLKEWFQGLPDEWMRIQEIPLLAPEIFSRISPKDVVIPEALAALFAHEKAPEQYLKNIHPQLQACIDDAPPNTISTAKAHYKKYCGLFEDNDEQFIQRIRDPQFAANLYLQDRQKIEAYFRCLAEAPQASRYFHFFAEIPTAEREARWSALTEFHLFVCAYEQAQADNLRRVDFKSQRLRVALHSLNPLISANVRDQIDPTEALTPIVDVLTPNDLKVEVELRRIHARGDNPPIEGGESVEIRESPQFGYLQLSMAEECPNIRAKLEQVASQKNEDPDWLVSQIGVDGLIHEYLVEREERQFVRAPSSLWLHFKRMERVPPSPKGCLETLFPCLFPSRTSVFQKLQTPIEAQQEISIKTVEEESPTTYQLDSLIVHKGSSMNSGHYVSYRLVEVEPGKKVWFEMNDSAVSSLTDEEALNVRKQAYTYHYSKV